MASLIDSLIKDMDKENSLYNELYELAKVKTTAIVNSDVEKLQAILIDEQALISKIDAVESDRIKVVDEICNILHLPSKDVKVEDVAQMLRKRPLEHNRLQESYLALKRTVKGLMQINENNKFLLKESLEMIEFNINLARSARVAPQTANYGKTATESMADLATVASFDAKQ